MRALGLAVNLAMNKPEDLEKAFPDRAPNKQTTEFVPWWKEGRKK